MDRRRTALVTGGARRVGRAIVERLAAAGFDVTFTYHTSAADAAAVAAGCGATAIEADLGDPGAAVAAVTASFKPDRLDLLVNSASSFEPARLASSDIGLCRRMMAVHFEAPLLLCKAFAPALRAAGGHVVNIVDLLAERPWPEYLAYCASKAALANLTLGLARELAPEVTVNGIAPGVVAWPDGMPEAEKEKYLRRVPLGRSGTPADVAEMVLYLATTGSYVTGQILRLDGGRSIT
jgi:pteridine reductase